MAASPIATSEVARQAAAAPRPPAPVGRQFVGGVVGFVLGAGLGVAVADATNAYLVMGPIDVAAGAALGTAVGVHVVSARHGLHAPFAVTLLGAAIGVVGLHGAPITMPLSATGAYNLFRRAR